MVSERPGSRGDSSLRFLSILLLITGSITISIIYLAYSGLPLQALGEDSNNIQSSRTEEIQNTSEMDDKDSSDIAAQPKQKPKKAGFTEYIDRLLDEEN